jgi:hypothetical protein
VKKDNTQDQELIQLGKPDITYEDDRLIFNWSEYELQSTVDRLTDDGKCEQVVYHGVNSHKQLIHISEVNLVSGISRNNFSKFLSERNKDFDWVTFETHIANETMKYLRREIPLVNLNTPFNPGNIEYLVYPVLPENTSTVIYCAGGKLKSYLALYIGCLVQYGITQNSLGWSIKQRNVLYLDWEEPDKEANNQRKRLHAIRKDLGITDDKQFLYMPCSRSFIDLLPQIKRVVLERDIHLVIIDSQMAATAGNANYSPDIVASLFYNAINSLHCTALIIDHITKADMQNGGGDPAPAAYGSIVKYNRTRVQYALETSEVSPTEFECSLIRTKNNNIPKIKPIGIKVEFDDDENGIERKTTFTAFNLEQSSELFKTMTPVDKIKSVLKHGYRTIKQIATETGMNNSTINTNLRRYPNIFLKSEEKSGKEDLWGLVDNQHQDTFL